MKKNLFRNKIFPLSSFLNKSQNESVIFKNIYEEKGFKINETKNNASIDYEDLHHNYRFNVVRKLSKSNYISQKIVKFSNLITNICSSDNIYKDATFMNAPSFNKNLSHIHQIIKGRRFKNIKLLDNMFFNSGFSSENMDEFNIIKKGDFSVKIKKPKLRPIQRNNSCEELIDVSNKLQNIIKNEESPQLSTNFSKVLNIKKNNSKIINNKMTTKNMKNNTSSYSTTTNKSIITSRFPEYQSNSNSKICINDEEKKELKNDVSLPKLPINKLKKIVIPQLNSQDSSIFDSEKLELESPKISGSFITSLNTDKMRFDINKLLIENTRGKEKIDKFEEKIFKMKIFQTYQKETLEKYINDERFSIQDKIDHIIKLYNLYEKIYSDYSTDLIRYINFLFNISNEYEIDLRFSSQKKKDINYEIEVLVNKLITKQEELEYLINTRNFIFRVKNRDKNIIKLDNQYVQRVSKRKKFVDFLFDLLGRTADSFAFKYLKRIIPLNQLEKIIIINNTNKKKTNTKRRMTLRQTTSLTSSTEKFFEKLSPPPPGEKIFETPDDFIKVLNTLRNENISLLKEYEISELEKGNLLNELNQLNEIYEEYIKSYLHNYINKTKKELEYEKNKFNILSKKCDFAEKLLVNKNDLSSLKHDFKIMSISSHNNIYFFNIIKYNKMRIKYKYEGLVLLEKLVNNISYLLTENETLKFFELDEVYNYIPHDILIQLLKTKKEYFYESNQYQIKEYTLQLIKLFEFLCQMIVNKNEESKKLHGMNYIRIRNEVQKERNIHNNHIIKKMLTDRREAEAKRLMEKWNRKTVLTRKNDLESQTKPKKKIIDEIIKEKKEKDINKKKVKENDEWAEYNSIIEEE